MSIYTFHVQDPAVATTDAAGPTDQVLIYDASTGKTSSMTRIQGMDSAVTSETTGAALAVTGASVIASTLASSYTMATAPVPGRRKVIVATLAATAKRCVVLSTDSSITIGSTNLATLNTINFSTQSVAGQTVELFATSTSNWAVIGNYGTVTFSTST